MNPCEHYFHLGTSPFHITPNWKERYHRIQSWSICWNSLIEKSRNHRLDPSWFQLIAMILWFRFEVQCSPLLYCKKLGTIRMIIIPVELVSFLSVFNGIMSLEIKGLHLRINLNDIFGYREYQECTHIHLYHAYNRCYRLDLIMYLVGALGIGFATHGWMPYAPTLP